MKNLLRSSLSLLLALSGTALTAAVTPTEWTHRQVVSVAAPGLVKIAVPAATFDAAQPGLTDLRLLTANGTEAAYLIDRDLTPAGFETPPALRPASLRTITDNGSTQLLIETGTTSELETLHLETSAPFFLKAAHGEISSDGVEWHSLGPTVPLFRQFGADHLRLALGRSKAAYIRITLDDFRSHPVTFSGAQLQLAPVRTVPPLPHFGAQIVRQEEFAGETVFTVQVDGRHAPLASLILETSDHLFMRRVTVTVREVHGAAPSERLVGLGTIYRVALDGAETQANLHVPLNFSPATRELLVHVHNGDSPPLHVAGVSAWQYPVNLLFLAPAAGNYTLLSGNAQAAAPRYDLAAFAAEMRDATVATVVPGPLETMPDYRPRDSLAEPSLPDVPLTGAPLDTKNWSHHREVQLTRAGVQELELDVAALAEARSDFADLRVLRGENQIPYVLERPALSRASTLSLHPAPDTKRPGVSIWQVRLPSSRLPLQRLTLTTSTRLFQRQLRIYEKLTGTDGRRYESTLAEGDWSRTPDAGTPDARTFDLRDRPRTDTLWIETDNGDNPALDLTGARIIYPVIRLIFKSATTDGFALAYGQPAAATPRYDLGLVAARLLTAPRNVATLSNRVEPAATRGLFAGLDGGYIFWGALALVVLVLLIVVARLLPKPPVA